MSHEFRGRYGAWALVAGASAGLGGEFATELARRGFDLVLLARRADVLEELAAKLRKAHRIKIRTASVDLADPDLLAKVDEAARGLEIGLLVYNAGFSVIGPFLEQSIEDKLRIIDVNCRGPVVLCHHFGKAMAARGRGGIVLMSSLAASQGSPIVATYAATKAFNLVLAEGLWEEFGQRGVDVLACRAGATRTPNYEATKPLGRIPLMEPAPVVKAALDALGTGPSTVPGWLNWIAAFVMARLFPRRLAIRIIGRTTRRMYGY